MFGHLSRQGYLVQQSESVTELNENNECLVVGAHLWSNEEFSAIPRNSVIYNLEQLGSQGSNFSDQILSRCSGRRVADYSLTNVQFWRAAGFESVRHLPVRFDESIVRSLRGPQDEMTYDVLFYGSINRRRQEVLDELQKEGVLVKTLFNIFGDERDAFIRQSKIVLNMHFYESSILELPRLMYLWGNSVPVVTEVGPNTEVDLTLRDLVGGVSSSDIVQTVVSRLNSYAQTDQRAQMLAQVIQEKFTFEGFDIFQEKE